MNNYLFLTSITLISTIAVCTQEPVSFSYTYKVIGASRSVDDIKNTYFYKEKLIETYENLVFEYSKNDHQTIIVNNLDMFKFDEHCSVYYNGTIVLLIDQGLGYVLEGKLKTNVCDEEAKNEKYFILELFS